jgi:hypothetical protein
MKNKKILIASISLLTVILLTLAPVTSASLSWNGPVRLTNHGGSDHLNTEGGGLALDNESRIHVVSYYGGQLYHIYDNQGWINESVVTSVTGVGGHTTFRAAPSIAIDSTGVIHIVYYSSDGNDYEIYYTHSTAGGGFSSPMKLTDNTVADDFPQMVIDSLDRIHVVYQTGIIDENDTITISLKYIHSTGFETFSAPENIPQPYNVTVSYEQSIAVDSNNVLHIAFQGNYDLLDIDYEIYYMNNSLGSFSAYDLIDVVNISISPSITIGPNDIAHIVFRGYLYEEIYYANNSLGSFNLSTPVKISTLPYVLNPRIFVLDNYSLYIFLYGNNGTAEDFINLYYVTNVTGSFSNETKIYNEAHDQVNHHIVIDSDENIHIVYISGEINNEDIYYLTTSGYYPVGVGNPFDPTFVLIIIGVVGAIIAIVLIVVIYLRYRKTEKEIWEPRISREKKGKSKK